MTIGFACVRLVLLEDPEMFAPKGILQGPFWAFVAANKNYAG